MSGHTAGPYEFSGDGIWATSPWNARVKIATVTFCSSWNGIDAKANGLLFAAAPTMYEALKKISESRWDENADLDDICTLADRMLALMSDDRRSEA